MRTREIFKYLLATIMAIGTTGNVMAQEKNLRLYFDQYSDGVTGKPTLTMKGDVPQGISASQSGFDWAAKYQVFLLNRQDCKDRVVAGKVTENGQEKSHASISFQNFKYEVKQILWNRMNDIFSDNVIGFTKTLQITGSSTPVIGSSKTGTEGSWAVFGKEMTFGKDNIPGTGNNLGFNGLSTFSIEEINKWIIVRRDTKLDDNCRIFVKAGISGNNEPSENDYAFQITYYEPELAYTAEMPSSLTKGETKSVAYQITHKGAFEFPSTKYTYSSSNKSIIEVSNTGVMTAKAVGSADITMTITSEDGLVVKSVTKTVTVGDLSLKYYCSNNTMNSVSVSSMNHTDNDYSLTYETTGFTLTTSDIKKSKACFVPFGLNVTAPKYTKVTPSWTFTVHNTKNSENSGNSSINSGIEVLYLPDGMAADKINSINVNTNTSGNTLSTTILKKYSNKTIESTSVNTSNLNANTFNFAFDNSKSASNSEKEYAFAAIAYTKDNKSKVLTTFSHSENKPFNYTYYAYITFHDGEKVSSAVEQVYVSEKDKKVKLSSNPTTLVLSREGHTFKGWSKDPEGTEGRKLDYPDNEACFQPYDVNHDGGVGPVDLYAFWEPNTYSVKLYRNKTFDGTDKTDLGPVTVTYGQDLPTVAVPESWTNIEKFVSPDGSLTTEDEWTYTFNGYSDKYAGGIYYYGRDGKSTRPWDKTSAEPLYAQWASQYGRDKYSFISFDAHGGVLNSNLQSHRESNTSNDVQVTSDGTKMTAFVMSGSNYSWNIYTNTLPISKEGYVFDGWYDVNGNKAYEMLNSNKFVAVNGVYWDGNGQQAKWKGTSNVTFYAKWTPKSYKVTLENNGGKGTGSVSVTYTEKMPKVTPPTKRGYTFKGYYQSNDIYNTGTQYYKSDGTSDVVWNQIGGATIYAMWDMKPFTIVFHSNYKNNNIPDVTSNQNINDQYNTSIQYVSFQNRVGYTLSGWAYTASGNVAFRQGDKVATDNKYINETTRELHLYAIWAANKCTVTLNRNGGTGGDESVTATYGYPLPSGRTAPTREGYTFAGYTLNGVSYYDKDMKPVKKWEYAYGQTLDAQWQPMKSVVTFDGTSNAVVPKQFQYTGSAGISDVISNADGVVKISFTYEGQSPNNIINGKFKKAGFKLMGFYDNNNVLVASVKVDDPTDRNIYFEENSKYWKRLNGNLVWNYTKDLVLTARYEPKYTLKDGNVIDFGTEYLEVGIDWENSMVHDLLGAAETEAEAGNISSENPVLVFDLRNANYLDGSSKDGTNLMQPLKDNDIISPNVLVYLGQGAYNVTDNEITTDNVCQNLYVTDRYSMKIPYPFKANKATYERNKAQKGTEDAMWQQSKESVWGTLCLPYPIKNYQKYTDEDGIEYEIRFYELRGTHDNYMQFYEMDDHDQIIAANTPVLYNRTAGVGSAVTVIDSNVDIPVNSNYSTNVINYRDIFPIVEGQSRNPNAQKLMDEDWRFIGNLEMKKFCTKRYKELCEKQNKQTAFLNGAEVIDESDGYREIYFFMEDKFTHLTSGVSILPYRAYFDRKQISTDDVADSKHSSYSILVVNADGTTTDITNLIDNSDAKGDGRIYDLMGRRVKQPVKGRIYIVDGKKKLY